MTDLHSAVRTAVDEARQLATEAEATEPDFFAAEYWFSEKPNDPVVAFIAAWSPRRALAMCDWADDVLARHTHSIERRALTPFDPYTGERRESEYDVYCEVCGWSGDGPNGACAEVRAAAAAFGVETGETP